MRNRNVKFNCKTAVLVKRNYLANDPLVDKIFKHLKLKHYRAQTFYATLYLGEITIETKNSFIFNIRSPFYTILPFN